MSDHQLLCPLCDKTFAKAPSLRKHKARSHPAQPQPKFSCFYCTHETKYKYALRKHIDKIHLNEDGTLNEYKVPRQPDKVCCLCNDFECTDRYRMIDHYVDSHDVQINETTLGFIDFDQFVAWKEEIESQEYCRFVASSSVRKSLTKHVWHFRCFRDGRYRSRGKGRRSLKAGGSVKIGSVCPCSIKASQSLATGAVSVLYVTPHVGHKPDISKLRFSREERDRIADRISAGLQDSEILASLHDSMSYDEINRMHLTTRKDIRNMRRNAARLKTEDQLVVNRPTDVTDTIIGAPIPICDVSKTKAETDERMKFEDMKRALLRNISSLVESAKNCDQLEVIREALLPVPKAIRELDPERIPISIKIKPSFQPSLLTTGSKPKLKTAKAISVSGTAGNTVELDDSLQVSTIMQDTEDRVSSEVVMEEVLGADSENDLQDFCQQLE